MTSPFTDLIPASGRGQAGSDNPFDDLVPYRHEPVVVSSPEQPPVVRMPPAVVTPPVMGRPPFAPPAPPPASQRGMPRLSPLTDMYMPPVQPPAREFHVVPPTQPDELAGPRAAVPGRTGGIAPPDYSFSSRLANALAGIAMHPEQIVAAPLEAANTVVDYGAQKALRAAVGDQEAARTSRLFRFGNPSTRDAVNAGAQLAVLPLASRAGKALEEVLAPTAFEGATLPPAAALQGLAARTAGRGFAGATIGATYAPGDPGVGAAAGAGIGLAEALGEGKGTVRRYQPPNAYPEDVTRQIGTPPKRPPQVSVTGRVLDAPNYPAEPDFAVTEEPTPKPEQLGSVGAPLPGRGPRSPRPSAPPEPPLPTSIEDIAREEHPTSEAVRASVRPLPEDMAITGVIGSKRPGEAAAEQQAPSVERTPEAQPERQPAAAANPFEDLVEKPKHEFSSTQLDLPPETSAAIKRLGAGIPDEQLAEDGREENPHITVKYGLHADHPEGLRALLADEGPIPVTLGKTSIFPNGESNSGDVVKVDVDSPELHRLNKKIADALPHTDTHPEYKPHATIAYVKPGLGEQYAGDESLAGHSLTVDRLTFSDKNGRKVEIPLNGARPSANPFEDLFPEKKTDLFGNAVAPTVEQGGLFGAGTGTQLQRDELKQLGRKDRAISPEEMSARRDVLGAKRQPGEAGQAAPVKQLTPKQKERYHQQRAVEPPSKEATEKLWNDPATQRYMEVREQHESAAAAGDNAAAMALRRQHRELLRKMTKEQRVHVTQWWYSQTADDVEDAKTDAPGDATALARAKQARARAQTEVSNARKLNDMDTAIDAEQYGQKRRKLPSSTEGQVDESRYRQTTVREGSRYEGDENPEALAAGAKEQARGYLNARLAFEAKMNAPEYEKLPAKKKDAIYKAWQHASDLFDATANEMGDAFGEDRAEAIRRELLAEAQRSSEPAPEVKKVKKASRKKVENFVNTKYRLDTNDDLYRRAAELEQRIQEYGSGEHGSVQWVRDAVDLTKPVSGYTAVHRRMAEDGRLYKAVLEELRGRLQKEGMSAEDAEDVIDENIGKHSTPGASATDFDPNDFMSEQRTGEGTVGAGFDKSIFKKLGANLYKGDITSVAVKEGLQNAVDALRGLGKNARGLITIDIDEKAKQVKITDTGVGMLPDVAANEFMDIGGSLKGEGASGGFGLAKVGLLASTRHFELRTVAGGERKGFSRQTKILTIISGSGEDWANGTLKFHTQEVASDVPTGSTLDLRFEESAKVSAYTATNYLARASHFSRLPFSIEATARDSYTGERKVIAPTPEEHRKWNNLNTMKPEPLIRFEVPGAKAEVYESEETGPHYGSADVHILNNGLYQFSFSSSVGETGPKTLVIDVHPTASIDSSDYPFTTNREQLKGEIETRLKDIASELRKAAALREIETLVNTMSQAPKIRARFPELANLEQRVVDTSGQIPSGLLQQIAKRRYAAEITDLSERAMQAIVDVVSKFRQFDPPVFGGLSTSKAYLGVNLNSRALNDAAREILGTEFARSEKNPFRGGNIILYNPWTTFVESRSRLDNRAPLYGADWAQHLADQWFGTMAHEVVHQLERGHEVGFAGTLTRVMAALGRIQGSWLDEADTFFTKLLAAEGGYYEDFYADYDSLKGYWSKADDLFKKFSDEQGTEGAGGVDGDDSGRDAMAEQSRTPRRGRAGGGSERHADREAVQRRVGPGEAGGPDAGAGARGAAAGGAGGGGVGSAAGHPTPDAPGLETQRPNVRPLEIVRSIKQLLNPESLGPEAKGAAGTIGHEAALSWRQLSIAQEALRDFGRYVGKLSKADAVKLWDAAEHGRPTGDAFVDRNVALLHQITEQYTKQLIGFGRLKASAVIANYIGRFWAQKKPSVREALRIIMGKRPFEGPKSFLKERTLVNFVDGLDKGLVPQTYNFVDAQLAKIAEMQRVIAAERMLEQEKKFGRAKPVMLGQTPPVDQDGDPWVRIDRDGNDPAFSIYLPPEVRHWEAFDAIVVDKLRKLIDSLGVVHERNVRIGGARLGFAEGDRRIVTKFGGPEGVVMHELGHILDARFGLRQKIEEAIGKAPTRTATKGKKLGREVPDYKSETPEARKRRATIREELRRLANLRRETPNGVPETEHLPKSDRAYLHSWPEKMANMVEAYIRVPDRFKRVAPNVYKIFDGIVRSHPELEPLRHIKPSLARESDTRIEEIPGIIKGGDWYAPKNAAAVWRNHLSRGLRGHPLFDAYMAPAQAAQQMLLGLSGFHATTITTEGAFSELAQAAQNYINGGARATGGAAHVGKAAVAPVALTSLGRRVMEEYRKPGTHPELAKVLDGMIAGGYRGKMASEFWTGERIEKFRKAFHETMHNDSEARRLLAASKLPFDAVWATIEATSLPVLGRYVPLMKTGALYLATADKLARLTKKGSVLVPLETIRREMRDLVKEFDYRFGQVDYDNFFINNAVKNLAQMVFLAPGWTFGTLALGARGVSDLARLPKRVFDRATADKDEVPPELLGKSAAYWIFGAVLGTAIINGVLTYLNTGERPHGMDFWAFRNGTKDDEGNENRMTIPGYLMKDVYDWTHHVGSTARNKLSPMLSFFLRIAENRDYQGDDIYDPHASLGTRARQIGTELAKENAPISLQNVAEQRRRGQSLGAIASSLAGISPARRELVRTPAEQLLSEYLGETRGPRTPQQKEAAEHKRELRQQIREQATTGRRPDLGKMVRDQELTKRQAIETAKTSNRSWFVNGFQRLTDPFEALEVYRAADPEQRKQIHGYMQLKRAHAIMNGVAPDRLKIPQ